MAVLMDHHVQHVHIATVRYMDVLHPMFIAVSRQVRRVPAGHKI